MSRNRNNRYLAVFIGLIISLIVLILLNLYFGSVKINISDIFLILFNRIGNNTDINIIWQIRLPRIIMVIVLGGALALSGFLLQTYFMNPIAGPYILGISSGAKLFVALALVFLLEKIGHISSILLIIAAFLGSLISVSFVLLLAKKIHNMSVLLVGGIMISYICSAITDFVITFASDSDIVNLHGWSLGSFAGQNWQNVQYASIIVLISFVVIFYLSKPIGALLLGESYAMSVGVDIKSFRVLLIILSSILSACVTAFAGPISFVGIAVPHVIRRLLNTSKPVIVIPMVFLGGAVFCLFSDLVARCVFSPTEMNISTVTALFGAPIVIAILLKKNRGNN